MADELRRALARTISARAERGEYGRLTYEALGQMVADWLGDPVPYTSEAVRTWVQTGRDPGFAVTVALMAILSPGANLEELARATYMRRQPRGAGARKEKAARTVQVRTARRATPLSPEERKRRGNLG